ncbi:hypothetical protein D3C80_2023190 [compost metagenome]
MHSNEQITAWVDSGGRFLSQHSQLGRSSSMAGSSVRCRASEAFRIFLRADGQVFVKRATQILGVTETGQVRHRGDGRLGVLQ